MPGRITLWGAGTSRTLRPIWVAEELGVPYDLQPIGPRTGETQTAEYGAQITVYFHERTAEGTSCSW